MYQCISTVAVIYTVLATISFKRYIDVSTEEI